MPIILDFGTWHVEQHSLSTTLTDAAGFIDSNTVTVIRSGAIVGFAVGPQFGAANDNVQAIGFTHMLTNGGGAFVYGQRLVDIVLRTNKQAGTAGNTVVTHQVLLFIRDARG